MYYLIAVLFLSYASIGESCRPPPCHWHNPQPVINYFHQVANKVIAADRKEQQFCQQHGGGTIKETHGPFEFQLVVAAGGSNSFEVKVRDRVVFIAPMDCGGAPSVRLLPPYVDAYNGHYCMKDGKLEVTFPYKFDMNNGGGGACDALRKEFVTLQYR